MRIESQFILFQLKRKEVSFWEGQWSECLVSSSKKYLLNVTKREKNNIDIYIHVQSNFPLAYFDQLIINKNIKAKKEIAVILVLNFQCQ